MDLKKEYRELLKLWRNTSIIGKVFISIGFFTTVSSITSISDIIYDWKGFILDGLEFYNLIIKVPIKNILSKIHIKIDEEYIDFYILLALYYGAILRNLYHYNVSIKKNTVDLKKEMVNKFGFEWFHPSFYFFALSTSVSGIIFFVLVFISVLNEDFPSLNLSAVISFILGLGLYIYRTYRFEVKNGRKGYPSIRILVTSLVLPILFVLILGAINSGLSRS